MPGILSIFIFIHTFQVLSKDELKSTRIDTILGFKRAIHVTLCSKMLILSASTKLLNVDQLTKATLYKDKFQEEDPWQAYWVKHLVTRLQQCKMKAALGNVRIQMLRCNNKTHFMDEDPMAEDIFSPNKTSAVYEKTSPRSDLRWKPTGRIFKSFGVLVDSYSTSINVQKEQSLDLSAGTY
ncbi:hypothetical protein Tco_0573388 [Tanacetum coccineum]